MTRKLTAPQLDVLRAVRDGNVYRSEGIRTLYKSFRRDTRRDVTRQANALADADPPLIEIGDAFGGFTRPWLITDAGRVLLDKMTWNDADQLPADGPIIVADPDDGRTWAYTCRSCRRIGMPFLTEGAARLFASRHDCDYLPQPYERPDPTGCDPEWAALKAAAWAVLTEDLKERD